MPGVSKPPAPRFSSNASRSAGGSASSGVAVYVARRSGPAVEPPSTQSPTTFAGAAPRSATIRSRNVAVGAKGGGATGAASAGGGAAGAGGGGGSGTALALSVAVGAGGAAGVTAEGV